MSEIKRMVNVILYEPEIPPNTGNLIRLCANTGVQLHLVEPLGFSMDTKALRRAGLDYHEAARVNIHPTIDSCLDKLAVTDRKRRVFALTTRGTLPYHKPEYTANDILLFGPETRGLPQELLADSRISATLRIPMREDSRSLNLSNAVAIVTFEVLRQLDFPSLG